MTQPAGGRALDGCSRFGFLLFHNFPVAIGEGKHPFPYRTR